MIVPDVNLLLHAYVAETDAQIAALPLAHDAVVHTTDMDFLRFPRLRWLNPLTGAGGRNQSLAESAEP